ncbi:MAG: tRNA (adenosine(37)-N6)-threonylcarbamoyltransferase complex transferase subunit TsaD [Candidatus Omnitrophica bacterium]|nr:tRNA (adenosine(37)-N6)-threonylcarbamoyltransferase complex transferase subunit TsaD [Candidatus Omnitrophota bacterium]MDD5430303.1 tRNA (adenosine(37)-N6)-threonylcarbamoyltransferase complex transferase subunit TsaD [Candidatus Omnitrophota bacterium]
MYTLGIETSCDETSCAILKDYRVLANITLSSLREHKKYGGVIPEIATRAHLKNIDKIVSTAEKKSGVSLKKINLITATYRPGLIGALVVGLNFAKALSLALRKPFLGVDHLHAHLFAPFLNNKNTVTFPFLGVVISGGHTDLYLVEDFSKPRLIGRTKDDACGEVYDKIAVHYGLGYPGGPVIDRLYQHACREDFNFKCGKSGFDLSFSGIKTALIYKKRDLEKENAFNHKAKIGLISSFQHTVAQAITKTIIEAADKYKISKVVIGGGVAANTYLRKMLKKKEDEGLSFLISPKEYSGDNAAAVAGLGFYLYNTLGVRSRLNLEAGGS